MKWLNKILGGQSSPSDDGYSEVQPQIKRGLPVHEPEIQGIKLARRDIQVTHDGRQETTPIDALRAQFYAGFLPGDAPVLVTNLYCETTYYCGEGTVASVVAAWESAPLEDFDQQDAQRMICEFAFSCPRRQQRQQTLSCSR